MVTSLTAVGCGLDGEPSDPCELLDLAGDHTRAADASNPAVVAFSNGDGTLTVLRTCAALGSCEGELLQQTIHTQNGVPEQIMMTGSGRWLTYRVGRGLWSVDLDGEHEEQGGPGDVDEVVGSLRGGDWIVYRSNAGISSDENQLWAYYAGHEDDLLGDDGEQIDRPHFRIGAGLDLRVAALGHRHLVARRLLGNGDEELYLVRIAPARRHDDDSTYEKGEPLLLARGHRFSRVVITEGRSPADHGDPYEFQHDVPTDVAVVATAGVRVTHDNGKQSRDYDDARTLVYRVSDLTQVANFSGAVVSSTLDLDDIAGLSAVSPDGSHLAYRTPRGSLALRNLETQRSCMVRPASSGAEHLVAGFGADGTLYFESRERNHELVYAYDTAHADQTRLSDKTGVWRLKAAPPQAYVDETGERHPWAVVAFSGFHAASEGRTEPIPYDDVNFLPRDDETLWLLDGKEGDAFDEFNELSLRRIQPGFDGAAMAFETESADPSVQVEGEAGASSFTYTYTGKSTVCMSASQAASQTTPWASQCSTPDRPTRYLNNGLPENELD